MKHLYIILFVLPLIGFGQGWEQNFGGTGEDVGMSVQQTTDEGYIICGHTTSFGKGSDDIYLIKVEVDGTLEWEKTFGGPSPDFGREVCQTSDGGYVLTGSRYGSSDGFNPIYLIKTTSDGNLEWEQTFGGCTMNIGRSVQQTSDGGYIIGGSSGISCGDGYVIKTYEDGNLEWEISLENLNDVYSIKQTEDGGYIMTGETDENDNNTNDVYLVKVTSDGTINWVRTFGGENSELGRSVQQTSDGGYVIVGYTNSFGSGGMDFYLIKTDDNGYEQWSQTFGGTGYDWGCSVQQTSDGGYIMTGDSNSFGPGGFIYLVKTNQLGVEQWSQNLGYGLVSEGGRSVQQTNDEGYIITGKSNNDVYLIKTDSEGNVETTSTIELPTPTSKRELIKTTNILGQENTTIKNQPLIEIYDDGSTEKKIVIE